MEGNMSVIPRTTTFEECNTVLDQPIQYFDANGNNQKGSFYPTLQKATDAAAGLQTRVTDLIGEFQKGGKVSQEMLQARNKCNDQFDQLKALGVMGTETAGQLRDMKGNLDSNSPLPSSKAIMSEGDIDTVCGNIDALVASLTSNYLTGGTFASYLPDYINTLNGFKV